MNLITDNQKVIASRIDEKLKQDGISVRACADGFNHHFKGAINGNKTKLINKDSIQRIRNARFKLPNQHVSELCDYLNVSVEIDADEYAKMERQRGYTILKDENGPIYLDELNPKRGRKSDEIAIQCGIMCEIAKKSYGG